MVRLTLLLIAVSLLSSACLPIASHEKTWKETGVPSNDHSEKRLKVGDLVRVHTKEGKTHQFRVTKIEETAFYGISTDNLSYRVGYGAIDWMEVQRDKSVEWIPVPIAFSLPNISMGDGSAGTLDPAGLLFLCVLAAHRRRSARANRLTRL